MALNNLGQHFWILEHCSSPPLWIKDDGIIRVTPPEGTSSYKFSWVTHATTTVNNKNETTQEARNNYRERYNRKRNRALAERNFHTVIQNEESRPPH